MLSARDCQSNEWDARAGRDLFHAMNNLWSQARAVGLSWGPVNGGCDPFLNLETTRHGAAHPSADTEQAMFKSVYRRPF